MGVGDEIREFLVSRRAKLTPEQAGLRAYSRRRRVTGLRREEVATLAGISVEYYTQLERGSARGVSDDVLEAVVHALQLDEAERSHLFTLVRTASTSRPTRRRPGAQRVRPTVQWALDAITTPAIVRNGRLDILAANALGRALYAEIFDSPFGPANFARYNFFDPRARAFFPNRHGDTDDQVALLRTEAGRDPYDHDLTDLIGELTTRSEEFRTRWASHNVKTHRTGVKQLHHPVVGELTLHSEALELPGDPGLTMVIYTTEPGSPSRQALDLLASWSATPATTSADDTDRAVSGDC